MTISSDDHWIPSKKPCSWHREIISAAEWTIFRVTSTGKARVSPLQGPRPTASPSLSRGAASSSYTTRATLEADTPEYAAGGPRVRPVDSRIVPQGSNEGQTERSRGSGHSHGWNRCRG